MGRVRAILLRLALGALAIALAACTLPMRPPRYESRPPELVTFTGILPLLREARSVDVLTVHGMCTHTRDDVAKSLDSLVVRMGGQSEKFDGHIQVAGTAMELVSRSATLPDGKVNLVGVLWSPLTAKLKSQLCFEQSVKGPACGNANDEYPYQRALVNKWAKDGLLNDCLADPLIYQGVAHDEIKRQMEHALLTAFSRLARGSSDETPLVLVSTSLGSKIMFDAVDSLLSTKGPMAQQAIDNIKRTRIIFMRSNQIPLLALADQTLEGVTRHLDRKSDPLGSVLEKLTAKPPVVAFTDPNDLFSYRVGASVPAKKYAVIDAMVSNDLTYVWTLENPFAAHMSYGGTVDEYIVRGCLDGAPDCPPSTVRSK